MSDSDDPMANDERSGTITRRGFLKVAGAAAAVAATTPITGQVLHAASTRPLKVGVISVSNGGHPGMQDSFLDGIRLSFDQAAAANPELPSKFLTRTVDGGHAGAYTAASSLLAQRVDVMIAEISAPVASLLAPLFGQAGVPLIVANVGAHLVRPSDRQSQVLHSSLLLWQASYALGGWAADYLGKRTYLLGSAADAGYDSLYAFRRGFEAAGGTVAGWSLTHQRPENSRLSTALSEARAARPNFVFGQYSGSLAADFIDAYDSSRLRSVPLAGPSFLADELVLTAAGASTHGIITAASWPAAITELGGTSAVARSFSAAYQARTGRVADAFAVLGYDAASVVIAGMRRARSRGMGPAHLIALLGGRTVQASRGALHVDKATNTLIGNLLVRRVQVIAGKPSNAIVDRLGTVSAFPHALASMDTAPASGYVNEYLCA